MSIFFFLFHEKYTKNSTLVLTPTIMENFERLCLAIIFVVLGLQK